MRVAADHVKKLRKNTRVVLEPDVIGGKAGDDATASQSFEDLIGEWHGTDS
jgi:hypothetical protein